MNWNFKEHQTWMIACVSYFVCAMIITLSMVFIYSPWFILLILVFYGAFRAKYTTRAKCPKCGHEFENDNEADQGTSKS